MVFKAELCLDHEYSELILPRSRINHKNLFLKHYDDHIIYKELENVNKEEFNKWFSEELSFRKTIRSFSKVKPPEADIEKFKNECYDFNGGECHYVAKLISIIDEEYDYYTGYIEKLGNCPEDVRLVPHSFNVKNGKVIDFARLKEDFSLWEDTGSLPHAYFGIKIPRELVLRYKSETCNFDRPDCYKIRMKPLLYEFYKRYTNNS